jgi:hypothetical protein
MPKGGTERNGGWERIDRLAEVFNGAALQFDTLAMAISPDGGGLEGRNPGLPESAKASGPLVNALYRMNLIINNATREVNSLAAERPGGQRETEAESAGGGR